MIKAYAGIGVLVLIGIMYAVYNNTIQTYQNKIEELNNETKEQYSALEVKDREFTRLTEEYKIYVEDSNGAMDTMLLVYTELSVGYIETQEKKDALFKKLRGKDLALDALARPASIKLRVNNATKRVLNKIEELSSNFYAPPSKSTGTSSSAKETKGPPAPPSSTKDATGILGDILKGSSPGDVRLEGGPIKTPG